MSQALPLAERPFYRWLVLANVMIGTFMAVLDMTIVNVALARIQATFTAPLDQLRWVLTAYLLAFGISLASSGWIIDTLGRKRTFLLSLSVFTAGSALCGLAWSMPSLTFFRIIQGIGAGFIQPTAMTIITEVFPGRQRGTALGFFSMGAAASITLGPAVGGYLVDHVGWRSIFYVNVPVSMVGLLATWLIMQERRHPSPARFDLPGWITMAVALSSWLMAMEYGQKEGWLRSPQIAGLMALAVISGLAFVIIELRTQRPLIDLRLFRIPRFSVGIMVMFIFGLGLFGSSFLLPLFLQNLKRYTAEQVGLLFMPAGIVQAVVAPFAGRLSDRIGVRLPALLGMSFVATGLFLNSRLTLFSMDQQVLVAVLCKGIGFGMLFSPLTAAIISSVPRDRVANASGLLNLTRQVGGTMGIALFGTMLELRQIYHQSLAAQALTPGSAPMVATLAQFQERLIAYGLSETQAAAGALSLVFRAVSRHAAVLAFQDAFFIAGCIALASLPAIAVLGSRRVAARSAKGQAAPAGVRRVPGVEMRAPAAGGPMPAPGEARRAPAGAGQAPGHGVRRPGGAPVPAREIGTASAAEVAGGDGGGGQ
ncbi:MAG: DHA2 family efflux MFS transporter permease subunit [Armatimonadetes bacterium]|nr:DHA2 family efflux MFS transporter permease subunit [Armatimonadota bacterium]